MEIYTSKYTGAEIDGRLDDVAAKQDVISDLDTIRSGAAKGATAIQSHQAIKTINGQSIIGSGDVVIGGKKMSVVKYTASNMNINAQLNTIYQCPDMKSAQVTLPSPGTADDEIIIVYGPGADYLYNGTSLAKSAIQSLLYPVFFAGLSSYTQNPVMLNSKNEVSVLRITFTNDAWLVKCETYKAFN